MNPIVLLEHDPAAPPGYLADAIAAAGMPSRLIRLYDGELLPHIAEVAAVVSLGGPMGAYDEQEYPVLSAEKILLRDAVARGVPVLGICLGCQLLADALGGRAFLADELEIEFAGLHLADSAKHDPVLRYLAEPVLSFHQDTWDSPPGVRVVVTSDRFPHAFRMGSAVAIQSHPEATTAIAASWFDGFGRELIAAAGINSDRVLEAMRQGESDSRRRAARLFGAWLGEVAQRTTD